MYHFCIHADLAQQFHLSSLAFTEFHVMLKRYKGRMPKRIKGMHAYYPRQALTTL